MAAEVATVSGGDHCQPIVICAHMLSPKVTKTPAAQAEGEKRSASPSLHRRDCIDPGRRMRNAPRYRSRRLRRRAKGPGPLRHVRDEELGEFLSVRARHSLGYHRSNRSALCRSGSGFVFMRHPNCRPSAEGQGRRSAVAPRGVTAEPLPRPWSADRDDGDHRCRPPRSTPGPRGGRAPRTACRARAACRRTPRCPS